MMTSVSGTTVNEEDLVLSVLRSPLRHRGRYEPSSSAGEDSEYDDDEEDEDEVRRCLHENDVFSATSGDQGLLHGAGDDTLLNQSDNIDIATAASHRVTAPSATGGGGGGFVFLRRFKRGRFGEAHHKRVPTPIKRKYNQDLRGVVEATHAVAAAVHDDASPDDGVVKKGSAEGGGVPDPYYPIYLPIDQAFKAKYVFHHKRGKTFQERVYVFLEHPGGWLCFIYHFSV
ncbi:hypothetical protein B566_EDAN007132 [Ephemera danica]|nr:hypothetical protein B566_EDAN007132 [Ephemera danica]